MVRAKFKCESMNRSLSTRYTGEKDESGKTICKTVEIRTLRFNPVYGNGDPNHENTKFWEATPSGILELGVVNAEAAAMFEIGKEYYLDFTPAETK